MQIQRDESMHLFKIDLLKLELEQIIKEKNVLEVENTNLRQIIEENSRHDIEFKSRIEELEKETNSTNFQCTIPPIFAKFKSFEDKEIKFLEQVYKEQIRNEIKERNREKKLRFHDPLLSDKVIEGNSDIKCIIQEVILFIKKSLTLSSDKNASLQNESNIFEPYNKGKMKKAKQKRAYQNSIADICSKTSISDKTAKNQVYAMIRASLSNVLEMNLYKKTQKAGNVYKLFGKITNPITKEEIKGIDYKKTCYILTIDQELNHMIKILPKADSSISVDKKITKYNFKRIIRNQN
ncbi:31789_t:CDS:2, partial [Gigaspora margarita]